MARRLSPTRRILCAPKAYLERRGVPANPRDLLNHDCLVFTVPSYGPTRVFRNVNEVIEVKVRGRVRSDSGPVMLASALLDLGFVVMPEWMVRSQLAERSLVRVLKRYSVNPHSGYADLYAVYLGGRGMLRKVRSFVDFLVQIFAEQESP